jgi:aspartyl protease family protein
MRIAVVLALLWCSWSGVAASPQVEVRGLYEGGAVLAIDGQLRTLRRGQTSPEGVTLYAADARQAVLIVDGERHTVGLSRRIAAQFVPPRVRRALVQRNEQNQYLAAGSINGHSLDLLVDTGANTVAISETAALSMGIDFRQDSARGRVRTASGLANSYRLQLDSISLGDITLRNVPAIVIEGDYPHYALLGMSFLRQVEMRDSAGVLYLEQF